ncbi:MAG: Tex family protein [Desulfoprunum sp.]|uniref:Tex family protein n=1 Tax=Desulfoprunum sp. TaxID=2020866 RepID=UPI003C72A22B
MTPMSNPIATIADRCRFSREQVQATVDLLAAGATIPFIARYRKEATDSLDEVAITAIRDQLHSLTEIARRRKAIIESMERQEALTEALRQQLEAATTMVRLEDIYLPFRPKRRTRGMIAREQGLAPLAEALLLQQAAPVDARPFIVPENSVASEDEALAGARDIIAETISEDAASRDGLRRLFRDRAVISSKVVKKHQDQGAKFRDYFEWQEPAAKAPGHRLLAMFRGDNEKVLALTVRPPEEMALHYLAGRHLRSSPAAEQVRLALDDGYRRLLAPSLENELRRELKTRADREAIAVFTANLRELLLAPPLGQKRVLALDPGFRTGAKLVCLDGQGRLLHAATIYPLLGAKQADEAGRIITGLVSEYGIEAIAIGNGTAGRETEEFVRRLDLAADLIITLVNEDGASVYSASDTARREFPDHDITVRGAVSIGRRLQDPLAELVKIEPKAIGVGQYQHDVDQAELQQALDETVISCVNAVGVELNTASLELLTAVSGLGPTLAGNIIAYRDANGPFAGLAELRRVPRLGPKAFEQCAGFLRIRGAANPLDASAVHPERYGLIARMATDAGRTVEQLMASAAARDNLVLDRYLAPEIGMPTLRDIVAELAKPGRDPRTAFVQFHFAPGIHRLEDLRPDMVLPAIITNVTRFGAFADIGVHQDGLIHVSQLADRFVKDPAEVVKVRQQVEVRVLEVDCERKRISLSMKRQG